MTILGWIGLIKEAIGRSLQDLSRSAENGTLWTSLIHKVATVRAESMVRNTYISLRAQGKLDGAGKGGRRKNKSTPPRPRS